MALIYGGSTSGLISPQITDIYLNDYMNNTITKQNLIDMLLYEIYDDRDGIILKHINNVDVIITKMNDNIILDNITDEGFYNIKMECKDSDNNIGNIFWKDRNNELGMDMGIGMDTITIAIKKNYSPMVIINDKRVFYLSDYQPSNIIDRSTLKASLVQNIIDDREGLMSCDITDIHIYQTAIESTSGRIPYYGTTGLVEDIDIVEKLYINEIGEYRMNMNITDSDNASTNVSFDFLVL